MRQKYDVYIGGKPLRFLGDTLTGSPADDLPVIDVRDKRELREVVARFNDGGDEGGVQVRSAKGFDAWEAFQADHVLVIAAGGLVLDEEDRLLGIRRLGKWDLPKGKVEKCEEIPAAAVREVQEECGLKEVTLIKPLTSTWHTYERKGRQHLKRTDWFLMRASAKERLTAQTEEDIEEVLWLDDMGIRMMEKDTYPSLLPVLAAWRLMMM